MTSGGVDSAPFLLLSACPPGAAVLVSAPWMVGGAAALVPLDPTVEPAASKDGFAVGGTPTSPTAGGAGFAAPTAGGLTGPPPPAKANAGGSSVNADNTTIAILRMMAFPIRIE